MDEPIVVTKKKVSYNRGPRSAHEYLQTMVMPLFLSSASMGTWTTVALMEASLDTL